MAFCLCSQSVLSATRISGLATFIEIVSCLLGGAVVSKIRRLKWILVVSLIYLITALKVFFVVPCISIELFSSTGRSVPSVIHSGWD